MSSIRSFFTMVLVSLLFSAGCSEPAKPPGTGSAESQKTGTKAVEPKGPGGGDMK
jgi:hypothetical protein